MTDGKEQLEEGTKTVESIGLFGGSKRISEILKDKETIDGFLRLYKATIQGYTNQWDKINEGRGYNVMIKSDIDMNLMDSAKSMAESMM